MFDIYAKGYKICSDRSVECDIYWIYNGVVHREQLLFKTIRYCVKRGEAFHGKYKEVNMGEKRYIISDASKMLGVESHVLRYWEEELNVVIPRNEMGHRYYTDNHINLLKNVRDLKNQGYSLRTIKMMLTDPDERKKDGRNARAALSMPLTAREVSMPVMERAVNVENTGMARGNSTTAGRTVVEQESKMEQFQAIMNKVVCKALKTSASELGKEVSGSVSETVLKEMNYLIRTQDEREEERFKKLDEAMRSKQRMSKKNKKKQAKAEKMLLKKTKRQEQKEEQEKQKAAAAEKKKQNVHIGKKVVTG